MALQVHALLTPLQVKSKTVPIVQFQTVNIMAIGH